MADKLPKKEAQKEISHEELKEIAHEELKELGAEPAKIELEEEPRRDLESDLVRLQAEFENYKKRNAKELAEKSEIGKMEFAKSLLHVLDEFEHALAHLEGEQKKGVQMLFENMKKTLEKQGVREMKCEGEKYDPYKHEVILAQESEKPEGTIITVARKGYLFRDRVLRHAQVIIAKKKEEKNKTNDAEKG